MSKRKLLNPYDSPGSSASPLLNPSSTASPAQDSPLPVDPQEELDDQESDADADLDVGDQDENVLIKALSTKIVGLTPLKGANLVKKGTPFDFRRDKVNAIDRFAVEVRLQKAAKSLKVGLLMKTISCKVAGLLDQGLITLQGVAGDLPTTRVGKESLPFHLEIYGARELRRDPRLEFAFTERTLRQERRKLRAKEEEEREATRESTANAMEEGEGGQSSDAAIVAVAPPEAPKDELIESTLFAERLASVDMIASLFAEGGLDPCALPDHPCPPGKKDRTMRTDLMPFQRQGLAWMIGMEHPKLPENVGDPPTQLWSKKEDEVGGVFYCNLATKTSQREAPILKRGGLLADEMGLGKTMQTIALIMTDDTGKGVIDPPEEPDDRFDDMTLIVCPLSVASNWTDQFHTHIGSKRLRWHLYHGERRDIDKKMLRKNDVVITTYQTLALEFTVKDDAPVDKKAKLDKGKKKQSESLLHKIKWRRIVLDEGHVIKNPKAKMSLACAALIAERRWILTGTPIVNAASDFGAMLGFLRMCRPLDERSKWSAVIESERDPVVQASLLRAIVTSTTLRRTKDMTSADGTPLIKLPPYQKIRLDVDLTPQTRALYDEINTVCKARVEAFKANQSGTGNYSVVLVYLLRLRQLACDPSLCPQSFIDSIRTSSIDMGDGMDEVLQRRGVLEQMINDGAWCVVCGKPPVDPRIAECEHIFCLRCIESRNTEGEDCPIDDGSLSLDSLVGPATEQDEIKAEHEVLDRQKREGIVNAGAAAKSIKLIEVLRASEPEVKSLVFSQWTSHLNCIEAALTEAGIVVCRFDGSMTQSRRESIISAFSKPLKPNDLKDIAKNQVNVKARNGLALRGPPMVMLISLKAGALGLNLTCASQVFLMDPWWQASIEKQAIDRVYRIGQTRPVKVYTLTATNTVEAKVYKVQDAKEAIINSAFSGNKGVDEQSKLEQLTEFFTPGAP